MTTPDRAGPLSVVDGGPRHLWDQRVPMRDGVTLSADVYLPATGAAGGPYPTVLYRTAYNNQRPLYTTHAAVFAAHGYATVIEDCRGRGDSDGAFHPFHDDGPDGYDTVEWVARQPWSTGKIGMNGSSYDCWTQWAAARERPPHLTTLVSNCPGTTLFLQEAPADHGMIVMFMFAWLNLTGGRLMDDNGLVDWNEVLRHLPLRELDAKMGRPSATWQEWLDHPTLDDYWLSKRFSEADFARIDLPVLHLTGSRDGDQEAALAMFRGMRQWSPAARKQRLMFGPWEHNAHWTSTHLPAQLLERMGPGAANPGSASVKDLTDIDIPWYDRWLKGIPSEADDLPACRYFVGGLNQWRDADDWPPAAASSVVVRYLHGAGNANTLRGDGKLLDHEPTDAAVDTLTYDPADPAPSLVGFEAFNPASAAAAAGGLFRDMRALECRPDVLVYTSEALTEPLLLLGTPTLTFHGGSDRPDTDWVVYLTDVHPDGRSTHLSGGLPGSGLLRARYRASLARAEPMEPGEVYEFVIELSALSRVIEAGHRIRVAITSSAFPFFDRNTNTGNPIGQDRDFLVAHNSVHHAPTRPSRLALPCHTATRPANGPARTVRR